MPHFFRTPGGGKYDIVVTTYEMANMERTALQKFRWKHIIVDVQQGGQGLSDPPLASF